MLGAALAAGDAELPRGGLRRSPARAVPRAVAPALAAVREHPPAGAAGATLSGSGPTVIVWAHPAAAAGCARELESRFASDRVLRLAVTPTGAGAC